MLALPTLGATPRVYTTAQTYPLAAEMALALRPEAPFRRRRIGDGIELSVLRDLLQEWLARARQGISYCSPILYVGLGRMLEDTIGAPPAPDAYVVWIANPVDDFIGSVWRLESRFRAIEARTPGLAATALNTIDASGAYAFPVYTPNTALYWASMAWWIGEVDERAVVEEYEAEVGEDNLEQGAESDVPTRKWLDKVLPPCVTHPAGKLKRGDLERLAKRARGEAAEIARAILAVSDAVKAERRRNDPHALESQHDHGFCAFGHAATLRWNAYDPMFRIFDDHGQHMQEDQGCDNSYGWIGLEGAAKLPEVLASLERRFAIARLVDELLPMVATRMRR